MAEHEPGRLERRRTLRIKRSNLLNLQLDDIDRPAIKIAETQDEYEQSFRLVHETYLRMGYLKEPQPHGLLFSVYSLLPETVIFVAKSYLTVISTLTEIFDTEPFGLPMDTIYKPELDTLRAQGRRVVELSALVTPPKLRWRNLFMVLAQVMYQYSVYRGVDDLCIAVNPKHVSFYKDILLFEDFGPERHYPRVDAPAVALRVDMHHIAGRLKEVYDSNDMDTNLYLYFHRMTGLLPWNPEKTPVPAETSASESSRDVAPPFMNGRKAEIVRHFFDLSPSLWDELNPAQKDFFMTHYPRLQEKTSPA